VGVGNAHLLAARASELPLGRRALAERLVHRHMCTMAEVLERRVAVVCVLVKRVVIQVRLAVLVAAFAEWCTEGVCIVTEHPTYVPVYNIIIIISYVH